MPNTKIATCCYCGTRAALILRGKDRHELSCSTCGAPLHEMKMLRQQPAPSAAAPRPARSDYTRPNKPTHKSSPKKKSRKRRKSFKDFLLDEVWDTIEDIFD